MVIECKHASGFTYQEEMDYIVQADKRNKYIRNLAAGLQGKYIMFVSVCRKTW